jgi:hypothetical protein
MIDRRRRLDKEKRMELLLDFQEWYNEEVGDDVLKEISAKDLKKYLMGECPACKLRINSGLGDWLKCKVCR